MGPGDCGRFGRMGEILAGKRAIHWQIEHRPVISAMLPPAFRAPPAQTAYCSSSREIGVRCMVTSFTWIEDRRDYTGPLGGRVRSGLDRVRHAADGVPSWADQALTGPNRIKQDGNRPPYRVHGTPVRDGSGAKAGIRPGAPPEVNPAKFRQNKSRVLGPAFKSLIRKVNWWAV